MNKAISDYIYLSKLFGACIDFVQGTGGNISVKTGTEIVIKKSGFAMAETSVNKGYLVCSLESLKNNPTHLEGSIISGDLPGKPSMETIFHLLPTKYIVHIHPTILLKDLCSEDFGCLRILFPNALFVPYLKPGKLLGDYIHAHYSSKNLILLANHGAIFLADTLEQILNNIDSVFQKIGKSYSDILFLDSVYRNLPHEADYFIKPSFLIKGTQSNSVISRFTPDFHLFLGSSICIIDNNTNILDILTTYKLKNGGQHPSILYHKSTYYFLTTSYKSAEYLEQMLYSYHTSGFDCDSKEINHIEQSDLTNNPQENQRVLIFKALG